MVLYKVYSQEHRLRYFAHPCSSAVLFQLCCLLLTFVPPLFTSYFTGGFYYKESTYSEQPRISFSGKYQLITGSSSLPVFSSWDARLNNYFASSYYYPSNLRTDVPRDVDGDGIIDQNIIILNLVLPETIAGKTINLWLLFQYALNRYPLINMEALGVISLKAPPSVLENATATVYGQLRFQQREAVTSHTNDTSVYGSVIDYGAYSLVPAFDEVLNNYASRNYFTTFDQDYVQWSSSTAAVTQLTLKVVLNTGLQPIRYVPSFWKEVRWTWIQYVTALIPFLYVMNKVKEFAFSNRLVRTIVKKSP